MIFYHGLVSSSVVFLVAATVSADLPIVWKFAKGQSFELERTASQKVTVDLKGEKFNQEQASTWVIRFEVKDKRGDNHEVQATFAKVEHKASGGDVLDPKLATKLEGSEFLIEVTPAGRIAKLQGYANFVKRVAGKDVARRKALQATLPEAALREAFADVFGPLPTGMDKAFRREIVEPIPHFGSLSSTIDYEYVGTKKGRDVVSYTAKTTYLPPLKVETAILRVSKGALDTQQTQGTIALDKESGRLASHERTMSLRGTLTIEFMDRKETAAFTLDNDVKIRLKQ